MSLKALLAENRDRIVDKWFDAILVTYPEDSRPFFAARRKTITNPVGATIGTGLSGLLDCLLSGADLNCEEVRRPLDDIIRIRAVQEFSPAQALGFIFDLKAIVRQSAGSMGGGSGHVAELSELEARIDELMLIAFDIFMKCREKIYELKCNEFKRRYSRIVERACQTWESGDGCVPEKLNPE